MPDNAIALELIRAAGVPIAAPSANRSGRPSPTDAATVREDIGDAVAMVLDGGPARVGLESTVLDVSGGSPVLLRPGGISKEEIEEALQMPVLLPTDGSSLKTLRDALQALCPEDTACNDGRSRRCGGRGQKMGLDRDIGTDRIACYKDNIQRH